jgi:hypothetical protein
MLAIAISLLFGLAAFAALAVIRSSVTVGARRARTILAELAEIERRAGVSRSRPVPGWSPPAPMPVGAAA